MKRVSYTSAIGSLICYGLHQAYLAHDVRVVNRLLSNIGRKHWDAVKWIFRYLDDTSKLCLCYGNDEYVIDNFTSVDMAGEIDSRKSTSLIYIITDGGGVVSWQ